MVCSWNKQLVRASVAEKERVMGRAGRELSKVKKGQNPYDLQAIVQASTFTLSKVGRLSEIGPDTCTNSYFRSSLSLLY